MAVIIPPDFTPPPLAGPEVPIAQRAEALRRSIAFEQIRSRALGDIERSARLQRLQEAIQRPPSQELIVPVEEFERIERIAEIEAVPIPERIPEELRGRRPSFPTGEPTRVPEPIDVIRAPTVETVTREEAVKRLREFAPSLTERAAERLVVSPQALERFVEAQQRITPEAKLQFGIAGRFQQLEEAGEFVGIPRTREQAIPIAETLKEFALDITPIIGTQRQVESLRQNWDQLSSSDKAFGVGLTAVSAIGDAVLVVGPAKLGLKLLKGSPGQKSKVAQTLITSEADEAADLLFATVGRRADAADEVRLIARELEQLDNELTLLRAPTGETQVQTAFARRNIRNIVESEDVPQAVEKAINTLEEVKKTPLIQQRERNLNQITGMQERLGGLTDDLISGQRTPVEFRITAGTSFRDLDEIEKGFTKVVETPGSLRGTERIVIETPATSEGVRALIETDDVLQRIRRGAPISPEEVSEFANLQSKLKELREATTITGPRGVPQTSAPALARLREFEETALPRIHQLGLKDEVQDILARKVASELVVEKGASAAALKQSQVELRGVVSSNVINDIERLIISKNPVQDSRRILDDLARMRSRAAETGPKEFQAVLKAEREVATFAEQQQEAVRLAEDIASTLQNADVRSINLRAVVREGSSSDLDSLAEFLVQGRGEGNLTDITNLIRTKQARGEDVTDLLSRQSQIQSRVQEEVSNLSRTFGTLDPEASVRFANLLQDSLERRRIVSSLEVENIGSALRPLTETEITELGNLESRLSALREASRSVDAAAIKFSDLSPTEALRVGRQQLREFEQINLPRLKELRSRPQVEVTPDVRSIKLEPEPPRVSPVQPTGPGFFGTRPQPPTGGVLGGFPPTRGGTAVLERPVGAISIDAPIGGIGPRLEVVTTLRTLRQPKTLLPVVADLPFSIVEAPERPAPDIVIEPRVVPEISPNGVPEVTPIPEEPRRDPRRLVPSPRRVAPEPDIDIPEAPPISPTPRRETPPVREPFVVPVPEIEPEREIPPEFVPVPIPPAIPGVRVAPSPIGLPLVFVEPEVGVAEGEETLTLRGIFPEVLTGIDQPTISPPRAVPRERPRPRVIPEEFEGVELIPDIVPTILPDEEVITGFEPELFERIEPLVAPEPDIIPEPRPDIPPKPPRLRVPTRPKVPPRRGPRRVIVPGEEELREVIRPGRPRAQGVAWKQGEIWVSVMPPFGEDNIFHSRNPLPQTRRVRNPRQAFRFIEDRLGHIPAETYDEWAAWFSARPPEEDITVL